MASRKIRRPRNRYILATLLSTLAGSGFSCAHAAIPGCAANFSIDHTFTGGMRWEMCWAADARKGLVLNEITMTPRTGGTRTKILQSGALAQVQLAYDDSSVRSSLVSEGGLPMLAMTSADCPGGTLMADGSGRPVLCQTIVPRGYAWRGSGQVQGERLVVYGLSGAGTNTYIQRWVFDDDGSIQPGLGVTGALDPARQSGGSTGWPLGPGAARYATNRFHTAYWRLDFAIGGQANDQFQQLQYTGSSDIRSQSISTVGTEGRFEIAPELQRFWVVRDTGITNQNGHNISYQIVPNHAALYRSDEAYTSSDIYVTQARTCEEFASQNPTAAGCAADLPGYVNGEQLTDLIVWVGTTWHQVPRSEDEASTPVHWQGVTLAPRDFIASSPLF